MISWPSGVTTLDVVHVVVTPDACDPEMNTSCPMREFPVALFPFPVRPTKTMFLTSFDAEGSSETSIFSCLTYKVTCKT